MPPKHEGNVGKECSRRTRNVIVLHVGKIKDTENKIIRKINTGTGGVVLLGTVISSTIIIIIIEWLPFS